MIRLPNNPEAIVQRIQAGDGELREQFIEDSIPFIKRVVRRITHTFFVEQEDEFSIALESFNQAINRFQANSDVPFEPYAVLLIKNRLYNWIRDQKQARQVLSMTDCENEDGLSLADQLSDPRSGEIQQNLEFDDIMAQIEIKLKTFGLSMLGLADKLPQHQDSRMMCIRIAKVLSEDALLYHELMQKHRLPCAELSRRCEIPIKTFEKNRSSIILLTLLMHSELQVIQSYVAVFEKEGSK